MADPLPFPPEANAKGLETGTPRRRGGGNVEIPATPPGDFQAAVGTVEILTGFPRFPRPRHFHGPFIQTTRHFCLWYAVQDSVAIAGKEIMRKRTLEEAHPDLAAQWHPTKNGALTPADVSPGSRTVAWWICFHDHEWSTSVGNRLRHGCPYCAGMKVDKEKSLAVRFPEIAAQWHLTRNGNRTPAQFLCGSGKKAWWRCARGHEWNTSIYNRAIGRGCPYCAGKYVTPEKSLAARFPKVAAQWHPEKNGALTPRDVLPHSSRKVRGTRCPYCASRQVNEHNSLQALFPSVARQWHSERNGTLTPADVLPAANRKVWWQCTEGHEWQTTPNMRTTRGTGCPYCAGMKTVFEESLAGLFPAIAAEWHPVANGRRLPGEVSPGSNRRAWWLCPHGHAYQSTIRTKVKGAGCPICMQSRTPVE